MSNMIKLLEFMSQHPKIISIILTPIILLSGLIVLSYFVPAQKTMDIQVTDLNNNVVSTNDFKGKIQIVDFMATWCTTCAETTNVIATLLSKNEIPSNVIIWTITVDPEHDSSAIMKNYIQNNNITQFVSEGNWIVARDVDMIAKNFNSGYVPYVSLLGKDLKILHDQLGTITQSDILTWLSKT